MFKKFDDVGAEKRIFQIDLRDDEAHDGPGEFPAVLVVRCRCALARWPRIVEPLPLFWELPLVAEGFLPSDPLR